MSSPYADSPADKDAAAGSGRSLEMALAACEEKYQALLGEIDGRVAARVNQREVRQRQRYQSERLASVGQLAAGVAHEINNPIGFVRSNLNSARKYLGQITALAPRLKADPAAAKAWAEADMDFLLSDFSDLLYDSVVGVDRVARIVADLKGFSSVDRPEEGVISINTLLDAACTIVEPKLAAGAVLKRQLTTLVPTLCLPGHLSQALLNLLTNARQAIAVHGAAGEIRVATHSEGDLQIITIEDNGEGIPPEQMHRIFDPFFTTRAVGQGTGLGLTVARNIIQAHGGEIDIHSVPGKGTRVTVRMPE